MASIIPSPFLSLLGCLLGRELFLLQSDRWFTILQHPRCRRETGSRSKNVARDMEKEEDVFCVLGRSYRAGSPLRRQLGQLLHPESCSWDLEDGCA